MISHLELEVWSIPVVITLVAALRGLQPAAHLLNQLCGIEYYLSTPHNPIPKLTPSNQGSKFPLIKHLEWRSIDTGMIIVVVGELRQWKVGILTPDKT